MSNQQVDEVLNDYFSDLLGGSDSDSDHASEKTKNVPLVDSSRDKASSEELSQQANSDNTDTLEDDNTSKVEQTAKTVLPEESILESKTHTHSISTNNSRADKSQLDTSGSSYDKPVIPQSLPKSQQLNEPQALADSSSYSEHKKKLEKMLQQVTALNTADATPQAKVSSEPKVSEPKVETEAITSPLELITPDVLAENVVESLVEGQEQADSEAFFAQALNSQWNENGRPEWAQDPFDILLVEVNGLQLAVPLVALGQIQEIEEEITPLFGQSKWFMGLQKTPTGNVKVVNTAQFIMPERYKDQHNYKFVISINGLQWGLAVDTVKQPITIKPEEIRWRAKRESRPWMAGMVKDHMCVLLDIPKVGEILQDQDKNRVD